MIKILLNKKRCRLKVLIFFVSLLSLHQVCLSEPKLSKSLLSISPSDTTVKVWVFFTDKPERPSGDLVTTRALSRRKRSNFSSSKELDYPVSSKYLQNVQRLGAVLNQVYKWENCASFYVHSSKLSEIAALPIVKKIQPIYSFRNKFRGSEINLMQKRGLADSLYGQSYSQLKKINIPEAHDYLSRFRNITEPGSGIMVAVFDAGFRFDHNCFSYLKERGKIKAAWDFIDNDSTVYDPDSVYLNTSSRYYQNDEHGSTVLSLISGYDPGFFMGTAWGSELVLARTENGIFDGEYHYEEDNWFRAIVWAESIGVDIVSSSLAYRTDFSDSTIIIRSGDTISVQDYKYDDLDGKTTLVSRAAHYAIERGVVIVNSIGNEGSSAPGTLSSPADVEEVISVGAVTPSEQVAYFSSTGPTADGRTKPDLVAQGTSVTLPVIYGGGAHVYSAYGQGTSFSTPMIAGLCALIMQSYSGCNVNDVRDRLYRYCKLLNKNNAADNYSGRGLPDALLSCMRDNEIYVTVKDTVEKPVPHALVTSQHGDSLGITDKDGIALVRLEHKTFPLNLFVNVSGLQKPLTISSVPSSGEVVISTSSGLLIQLEDKSGPVINGAKIYYKIPGVMDQFVNRSADSLGRVLISMYREATVQIYVTAEGYFRSDTMKTQISFDLCTLKVLLEKIPDHRLIVYPNVLKKGGESTLFIDFIPGKGASNKVMLSIRSIDGALVWKKAVYPGISERLKIKLNGELNRLAPGFYFLILENERDVFRRKILIAG